MFHGTAYKRGPTPLLQKQIWEVLQRANLGAYQNRLEHTVNNLGVAYENTVASESRIRDADFAEETVNFTKSQILQQSSTAILAQASPHLRVAPEEARAA